MTISTSPISSPAIGVTDDPAALSRAARSARRYYWLTAFLVVITVLYSIATYVSTSTSKHVLTTIINTCRYEDNIPCPPSFLQYIEKKDVDTLEPEFVKRSHFAGADYGRIMIRHPFDFNMAISTVIYDLKVMNLLTSHTLPTCLKYYDNNNPAYGCVGEGTDKVGAFIALFDITEQLLAKARLIYDSISTFLLPVFYSLLGASVYNLRSLAALDGTTATSGSLLRASTRMLLALTAGAIIGFFEQGKLFHLLESETSGLPQQATAFLAGYGVEILFSAFDGIVDVFKKLRPTT